MQSLHLFASLALLSAYNFSCVPDAFALVRLRRSPRPHSCSKVSKRFLVIAGYVQESILGHLHRVSTARVTAVSANCMWPTQCLCSTFIMLMPLYATNVQMCNKMQNQPYSQTSQTFTPEKLHMAKVTVKEESGRSVNWARVGAAPCTVP